MTRKLITVLTGANRGIGSAIATTLATTQHAHPLIIYATSRQGTPLDITASHDNEIHYARLDISDRSSILDFLRSTVKSTAQARAVDVLINNAGVNLNDKPSLSNATRTVHTNYGGTRAMCEVFLQHGNMASNPGARIVNVSSVASEQLSSYSDELRAQLLAPDLRLDTIDDLATDYLLSVESDTLRQSGWAAADPYSVSKVCVNAMTAVLARQNPGVLINCCCPGWVASDMGHQVGKPPKSLEDGAKIPVKLAVGAIGDVSGKYWSNPSIRDTGDGELTDNIWNRGLKA